MSYNPNDRFNNSSDDVSISANSVFDWGNASVLGRSRTGGGGGGGGVGMTSTNAGSYSSYAAAVAREGQSVGGESVNSGSRESEPTSRYDPKAMSRIVDITDLVDESSDGEESDDDIIGGGANYGSSRGMAGNGTGVNHSNASGGLFSNSRVVPTKGTGAATNNPRKKKSYGPGSTCRHVTIMIALVAVIVGAILAIGFSVVSGDIPVEASSGGRSSASASASTMEEEKRVTPEIERTVDSNASPDQQELLETAERVVIACAPVQLDQDMSECQSLCNAKMCCFEGKDDPYNCEDDETKMCGVFAGCKALMEGEPVDGEDLEED